VGALFLLVTEGGKLNPKKSTVQ